MSSYDSGDYYLREEARKQLRIIEEETRRKMRDATDRFTSCLHKAQEIKNTISSFLLKEEKMLESYTDIKDINQLFTYINRIKNSHVKNIERLIERYSGVNIPKEHSEIISLADEMEKDMKSVRAEFYKEVDIPSKKVKAYIEMDTDNLGVKENSLKVNLFTESIKNTVIIKDITFSEQFLRGNNTDLTDKFNNVLVIAEKCYNMTNLDSIKSKVLKIIATINSISNKEYYEQNTILDQIFDQLTKLQSEAETKKNTFDRIYSEYLSVCILSNNTPKSYDYFKTPTELKSEYEKVRKETEELNEHIFITEQINEVMQELGYKHFSCKLLNTPKVGTRKLYKIKENIAISVYVSEENKVNTQLIIIGSDTSISGNDYDTFEDEQKNFCRNNFVFSQKLLERGIQIEHRSISDQKKEDLIKEKVVEREKNKNSTCKEMKKKEMRMEEV